MSYRYSPELKQFILDHHYGLTASQLADLMSWHFGETFTTSAIRTYKNKHKIYSGSVVPRKRTKFSEGWPPTQFKKGEKPLNYRPIGTERIDTSGYHVVKTTDGQKKWTYKHVLIWEQHHGKVPKGHVVIFGDGNKNNLDPNNLILVSRAQLAMLNKYGLIKNNADLTRVGVTVVDLKRKIWEAQKP